MKTIGKNHELKGANSWDRLVCLFNTLPLLMVLAALITSAFSTKASASEPDGNFAVTVLVFNFRQAPTQTLAKAKEEAGRILGHAGVHVIWRDCPIGKDPCEGRGRVLFLAITKGPAQNHWLDTVSGYADLPNHLAVAYYDYLPRIPDESSAASDTALILGSVIAHELGHLLLGAHGHSIGGIMKANWDVQQTRLALMSQLSFLPEEAKIMQGLVPPGAQQNRNAMSALISHYLEGEAYFRDEVMMKEN